MKVQTLQVFVAGHTDDMMSSIPRGNDLVPVDLRSLKVAPRFDSNQFAESRFLVSEDARVVEAEYVGFCSANYDRKFLIPPRLVDLSQFAPYLRPSDGLGPQLSGKWIVRSEEAHPGMGAVLERLARHFGLTIESRPVPQSNTLICHRDEWFALLDAFQSMLTAVIDWYGTELPYGYRCLRCGAVSESGTGRYTRERHISYLAERLTPLHFSSRSDITFVTPAAFRLRTAHVGPIRKRLLALTRQRGARMPGPAITPFDGPACTSCSLSVTKPPTRGSTFYR